MTRTLADRAISAARSAWYASTEPARLKFARIRNLDKYARFRPPEEQSDGSWVIFGSVNPPINPLVTIFIPTHNRVKLLFGRALPSVQAQTYRNLEIIVAAHGCTDETGLMTCVHASEDKRIRLIVVQRRQTYPPNAVNHWFAGPVAPSNAALKAARGDWIMRIDDDDILEPDAVERLLRLAQNRDLEFVSAAHETHAGRVEPYDLDGTPVGGIQTCMYRSYLKFMRYNPDCWRKARDRVNDVDLQRRMVRAGVRMGYMDRVVARVLPRPGETFVGSAAYLADPGKTERAFGFCKNGSVH